MTNTVRLVKNPRPQFSASSLILTAVAVLIAIGLITCTQPVAEGVRKGLLTCANVIIPSLFPFMALSGFLALSSASKLLSKPLGFITRRVFKLPTQMGAILLMSFLGGYPVGAKNIALKLEQGVIDEKTASRMLCFCVNAGPSFLINAVGVSILGNATLGWILLCCHILAALIVGIIICRKAKVPKQAKEQPDQVMSAPNAFVMAVTNASTAIITMCAFIIAFSALISLLEYLQLPQLLAQFICQFLPLSKTAVLAFFSGILEVTTGCLSTKGLAPGLALTVCAFLTSFAGTSILCQAASFFRGYKINFRPLILSRLASGCLAALMAHFAARLFAPTILASHNLTPPLFVANATTGISGVCILLMITMLLIGISSLYASWQERRQAKIPHAKPRV